MPIPLFGADPPAGPAWLGGLTTLIRLWPIWLPLLAGGAAIFLLLPRPRAYPAAWGALAGVVGLLLAGFFLVGNNWARPETVLFYTFSALAVLGGALLVTQRNPAHAALSFALVILNTCGLFLLLAAPFLMAATVIIYAGAIVVTFLFVIMLAQQSGLSDADARSREPLLATLTGFLLLAALLYVVQLGYDTREVDQLIARAHDAAEQKDREAMERVVGKSEEKDYLFKNYKDFMAAQAWPDLREAVETLDTETLLYTTPSPEGYRATLLKLEALGRQARTRLGTLQPPADLPLSGLSGPPASTPPSELRRDAVTGRPQLPAENSAYLGRSLFTDFLLPVELGGMLLLVAALGAVAIAHRRTPHAGPEADGGPERRA